LLAKQKEMPKIHLPLTQREKSTCRIPIMMRESGRDATMRQQDLGVARVVVFVLSPLLRGI